MSRSTTRSKVELLKEWKGSELPRNIWKHTKIYIYNYYEKKNQENLSAQNR